MVLQALGGVGLTDNYLSLIDALSAIRQLSEVDLSGISESQLLQQALGALIKHQDMQSCSLFLLQNNHLNCAAGTGVARQLNRMSERVRLEFPDSMKFLPGEGMLGICYTTGQIQYCRNCANDERFRPYQRTGLFYECGSLISAPVKSGHEVLGVLTISHPVPEFFEAWHQHFLMLFANCFGRFLHIHRLLNNLESAIGVRTLELERALAESEDLRQRYQRLSITDELTKLHNRRYFFIEGESMLARAVRSRQPISLLLLDVDHFKRINDNWGHVVGDHILKVISSVIREQIRTGDMVARLGGEEFVMMLPNTDSTGTDLMARRIQERISGFELEAGLKELQLTVSIGMTTLDEQDVRENPADSLNLLYRHADSAMYLCKSQGRNRRQFYVPELNRKELVSDG